MRRKGLGRGLGQGYRNLVPMDSHIHALSAKGVKTIFNPYSMHAKGKMEDYHDDPDFLTEWDTYEIGNAEAEFRFNNIGDFDYMLDKDMDIETDRGHFSSWRELYEEADSDDKKFVELLKELDLDDTFKDLVKNDVYEDQDVYDFAWQDRTDYLTEVMKKNNPKGYWKARVKNFGWRNVDGEMEAFYSDDGEELLQKILPKTENTFRIFKDGKGFKIQNFHHDSPTGNEWYYIQPLSEKEYEEETQ